MCLKTFKKRTVMFNSCWFLLFIIIYHYINIHYAEINRYCHDMSCFPLVSWWRSQGFGHRSKPFAPDLAGSSALRSHREGGSHLAWFRFVRTEDGPPKNDHFDKKIMINHDQPLESLDSEVPYFQRYLFEIIGTSKAIEKKESIFQIESSSCLVYPSDSCSR